MRSVTALSLAVVLVLAGAGTPAAQSAAVRTPPDATTPAEERGRYADSTEAQDESANSTEARDEYADPEEDVLGWENGYWHDEPIDVDNSDGLNDSEFRVVRNRTMARVEYIRRMEFESTPTFEFVSRERYQERSEPPFDAKPREDQFFEAGFWVGEDTPSVRASDQLYDVVVDGYFVDGITLIKNDTESPRVDPLVLAHELTHALRMTDELRERMDERPAVRDWSTAAGATLEGEASWVEYRYGQLCDSTWECIERRDERDAAVPDESVNMGLYLDFAASYSLGRSFMQDQYERDGIEGVNRTIRTIPQSSEQVIHPGKYGNDAPTNVTVADRTRGEWERIEAGEYDFPETYNFGEVGLYAMLWYNGLIDTRPVNVTVDQQTGLNYTHPATAGWDGDVVVPYTNGSAHGYVFKSTWDSEKDARQFHEAYLELLDRKGAEKVRENVYRIPDGPYADAFRVVRDGDTLLVVNAPTVAALDDVHGNASAFTPATATTTASPPTTSATSPTTASTTSSTTSTTASSVASPTEVGSPTNVDASTSSPDGTSLPGFGPVAAVTALLGAVLLLRRRN